MLFRIMFKIAKSTHKTPLIRKYLSHGFSTQNCLNVPTLYRTYPNTLLFRWEKPCISNWIRLSSSVLRAVNKNNINPDVPNHNIEMTTKNVKRERKFDPISNEELLEKYIANLSTDIHLKNRVYKNDLQRVIAKVKDLNFSTKKQGLLLLHCCTELLPDESSASRMALAEEVWTTIQPHTKFEVEHYNELLRVYIANNRTVIANTFIRKMGDIKPNIATYELMVEALGEAGDINQATEVISNMKTQNIPATESIFNSLIVCQGKAGDLNNIQEVPSMMTSLKLERSADTYVAIARALAFNRKGDMVLDELSNAQQAGIYFEERHIMKIVKTMADVGLLNFIPMILKFLPETTLKSPSISAYMQSVATQLVFLNHPIVALELYKCLPLPSFGPNDDKGLHGRSLVRDCVKANIPSSVIGLITQQLMASGRNPIAIQNAAEAALQLGKSPLALDLFVRMQQLGMPLRPHYFWPILLQASKSYGEKGIMNTLQTMVSMEVFPDYDTIKEYTLPYVSFTSPQNLMKKFQDTGLTASVVLTAMMETLLNTGQVRAASEICELFQGKVEPEKLLKPLLKGYLMSMDKQSTIHILQDITEKANDKSKDWVGRFLCTFIKDDKVKGDAKDFIALIKAFQRVDLKISPTAAEICQSNAPSHNEELLKTLRQDLIIITDDKIVDECDMFYQQMPHPKQMNEEALRAHLIELEAKGMNTRGVLRKLLQEYCRSGNLSAAKEIVEKCNKEGVFLSAGMKASIFDLHVKSGELDSAELMLADLTKTAPTFMLDEFKIIDFATLMVYNKKIDRAFDLIKEQSKRRKIRGGNNLSMNCWRLLDALAAHGTPQQTREMFELLTKLGYCKPTNVMMGPLIRVYLKHNNFEEAVNEFARLASTYKTTPLKHELLCSILKSMHNNYTEESFMTNERSENRLHRLAQRVMEINKKIHGYGDHQLTLVSVLADIGYKKVLRRLLLDPKVNFHPDALMRRCERFADERKVHALETFAECARDLRYIDVSEIYDLILNIYQREDNWERAVDLWVRMQENEIVPSQKFVRNLYSMLKANKKKIPADLMVLVEKQQKAQQKAGKQ